MLLATTGVAISLHDAQRVVTTTPKREARMVGDAGSIRPETREAGFGKLVALD
jgi:hypothetical protein